MGSLYDIVPVSCGCHMLFNYEMISADPTTDCVYLCKSDCPIIEEHFYLI